MLRDGTSNVLARPSSVDFTNGSLSVSSPLNNQAFTLCAWVLQTSVPAGNWSLLSVDNGSSDYVGLLNGSPSSVVDLLTFQGRVNLATFVLNQWAFVAVVGAPANAFAYLIPQGGGSMVSATLASTTAGSSDSVWVSNTGFGSFGTWPGLMAGVKGFGYAMSAREVLRESQQLAPVSSRKLAIYLPARSRGNVAQDLALPGRIWTQTGTFAAGASGPPVPEIRAPRSAVYISAAPATVAPIFLATPTLPSTLARPHSELRSGAATLVAGVMLAAASPIPLDPPPTSSLRMGSAPLTLARLTTPVYPPNHTTGGAKLLDGAPAAPGPSSGYLITPLPDPGPPPPPAFFKAAATTPTIAQRLTVPVPPPADPPPAPSLRNGAALPAASTGILAVPTPAPLDAAPGPSLRQGVLLPAASASFVVAPLPPPIAIPASSQLLLGIAGGPAITLATYLPPAPEYAPLPSMLRAGVTPPASSARIVIVPVPQVSEVLPRSILTRAASPPAAASLMQGAWMAELPPAPGPAILGGAAKLPAAFAGILSGGAPPALAPAPLPALLTGVPSAVSATILAFVVPPAPPPLPSSLRLGAAAATAGSVLYARAPDAILPPTSTELIGAAALPPAGYMLAIYPPASTAVVPTFSQMLAGASKFVPLPGARPLSLALLMLPDGRRIHLVSPPRSLAHWASNMPIRRR